MSKTKRAETASATAAEEITFEEGSTNFFEDIGATEPVERLAKAQLSRVISMVVKERGLTQKAAAAKLGIAASDMSDLMRGKIRRFSQERLERFLNLLDMHVQIRVGPRPAWERSASVTVEHVAHF